MEQRLKSIAIGPGPADVTSYHDADVLQLALPHISTELFDDALVERGRELYAEVVRVSQSLGVQPYTDAIDDILKLEELIGEARGLRDSGTEVVPPNILLLAPELTNTAWEILNPDARSTLSGLAVQLEILGRGRAIEAALGWQCRRKSTSVRRNQS